ncbi:MAG: hypothetical protein MR497_01040 [Bacilli bacterium]|nr:hypothetical protein [Bacilli bacterium]
MKTRYIIFKIVSILPFFMIFGTSISLIVLAATSNLQKNVNLFFILIDLTFALTFLSAFYSIIAVTKARRLATKVSLMMSNLNYKQAEDYLVKYNGIFFILPYIYKVSFLGLTYLYENNIDKAVECFKKFDLKSHFTEKTSQLGAMMYLLIIYYLTDNKDGLKEIIDSYNSILPYYTRLCSVDFINGDFSCSVRNIGFARSRSILAITTMFINISKLLKGIQVEDHQIISDVLKEGKSIPIIREYFDQREKERKEELQSFDQDNNSSAFVDLSPSQNK